MPLPALAALGYGMREDFPAASTVLALVVGDRTAPAAVAACVLELEAEGSQGWRAELLSYVVAPAAAATAVLPAATAAAAAAVEAAGVEPGDVSNAVAYFPERGPAAGVKAALEAALPVAAVRRGGAGEDAARDAGRASMALHVQGVLQLR
eukprot:CAMPEP_0198428344 /NCGR_PEP_ID=MMETSP1452-20131203/6498_1 /TAXON_ID=1181717 /ORGANISM="Synchroma pusillum, Strain CCMP3072" /LENGTH=150 /DNA_ID=CAMNT_0044148739 /DNA_START=39 /DNA_END=488 /DNA_ORIENTATION=+